MTGPLPELIELTEEGYIVGNYNHLIIRVPMGLGAGGQDILQWVGCFERCISHEYIRQ